MSRSKILWLTSWYPNKRDPFDGDFIQRHARAAAIHNDIHVLFVTTGNGPKSYEEEFHYATGLTEQIIYYKEEKNVFGWVNKQLLYFKYFKKGIEDYINKNGLPSIVHIHIPWKAGLLGLWIKRKWKIPYLITEHWGIYNTIEKENYLTRSFAEKIAVKYIFQQAQTFISVSKFLGEGVNRMVVQKKFIIMPNVVDTTLFHPFLDNSEKVPFTFIHVSNGASIKNIEGIIDAFSSFLKRLDNKNVTLLIVGTKAPEYKRRAQDTDLLNKNIFFIGAVPYAEVAANMKQAQALILFSHMENSPCVIGEALCCGLPIIATNVGGIPELLDSTNSILINANDTASLMNAMQLMIMDYNKFNKKEIANTAINKFSYAAISNQFDQIYSSIISAG
ncbi:MAG TPA: glycosyltransferase [Chitinophagaceae bacterium]|nr:glycosyltransferase [Chitinophagaceae bacterium]